MSRNILGIEMRKLVKEYIKSGESQNSFASAQGISKSKLHYWIKKSSKPSKAVPPDNAVSFVPIEITKSPLQQTDQVILIRLTSGVEIEIPI